MATPNKSYAKHPRQPGSSVASLPADVVATLQREFLDKQAYLMEHYHCAEPYEYYRDMFPAGSFNLFGSSERRPNGLISILNDTEIRGRSYNRMIFDDLSELISNLDKDFVLVAPVGYSGRRRLSKYAYQIFGFIFDLDDVGEGQLQDLLYEMENEILPQATYIVNSGTGLHVVYLFESPVPALPQYYESLNRLKQDLSNMIWNQYTSRSDKI